MKIRNFRLRLHFKDLRRKARRRFDLDKLGLDDAAFQALLAGLEDAMRPAVIYASFKADSAATARLAPIPGLAHTLGLATLGAGLAPEMARRGAASPEHAGLVALLAGSALDQAVQFVVALLKDELEAEDCELSPIHFIEEAGALGELFSALGGEKIDLALESGRLVPAPSAAFCLSWIAQRRRSKAASKSPAKGS